MKILAIETSCDDTCIALVETPAQKGRGSLDKIERRGKKRVSFDILSNVVSSQVEVHKKWGGVYPTLAKREHQKNLMPVLEKVLKKAKMFKVINFKEKILKIKGGKLKEILEREPELLKNFLKIIPKIKKPKIDAIAITIGPGLEPCLWVGINFAKALSYFWKLPLIPVNHIEAHIYANCLKPDFKQFAFPSICLIVSGGHTQLILMKNYGQYKVVGETRDDAAGECLDKIARILGLGYPGGPAIAAEAAKFQMSNVKCQIELPRPMIYSKDYDFSFSGLKTAVLYDFKKRNSKIRKNKNYIGQICLESQQAIIDVLIHKTLKAAKNYRVKTVILGGGVVANEELRKQFISTCLKSGFKQLVPPKSLCTDNAAMVAVASCFHYKEKRKWTPPEKPFGRAEGGPEPLHPEVKAKANLKLS